MPNGATYRRPCQRRRVSVYRVRIRWQVLHPAHLLRGQRLHLYKVSPAACNLEPSTRRSSPVAGGAAGGAEPLTATAVSLFGLSPDSQ
nr:MAG TPA: hypothetical protein [Caudoviricetes sp.]